MSNRVVKQSKLRENLIPLVGMCLCVYFSYHLALGKRSYMQHLSLKKTISKQEAVVSSLQEERYSIENKVKMMRPASVDRDLLTERVRRVLGYKFADESIIYSDRG